MKLTYKNEYFSIYDDFFEEGHLELIRNFIQEEDFKFAQNEIWRKVYRITDGNHLQGKGYASADAPKAKNVIPYPTNTAIDLVHRYIFQYQQIFEEVVGRKDEKWFFYTLSPLLFPKDAGVSWHDDYTNCSGTFTVYCHPEWNIQWGGEL